MIKLICFGKIKEKYLNDLIMDYFKRINKYHKLEIIELKDNPDPNIEYKELLNILKPSDNLIALDIKGEELSSLEFASLLGKELQTNSSIVFIIGGSNGFANELLERTNKRVSFSKLTMPHGLFRGVFLEQLYRAFKINNNETYHK